MDRKTLLIAATSVLLAIFLSNIFVAPAYGLSININLGRIDFSFTNKWGTYQATAYYNVLTRKPSPTVIIAHGSGATGDWYMWIVDALRKSGFVAVTFTCPQGLVAQLSSGGIGGLFGGGGIENLLPLLRGFLGGSGTGNFLGGENFFEATGGPFEQWSDGIISCIETITTDARLKKIVDGNKIGVIGHSAGGLGALIVGSQDSRIKVVVALAPPVNAEELPRPTCFNVPVQIQIGTKDGIPLEAVRNYFNSLNAPVKELIVIEGGNHMQFMDKTIVTLMSTLMPMLEPSLGITLDNPADISVEEQHSISSSAFLPFLSSAIGNGNGIRVIRKR